MAKIFRNRAFILVIIWFQSQLRIHPAAAQPDDVIFRKRKLFCYFTAKKIEVATYLLFLSYFCFTVVPHLSCRFSCCKVFCIPEPFHLNLPHLRPIQFAL